MPSGRCGHVIVRPLCRAVFGDMRLPAYKCRKESGVGPMGVLGSAVPVFTHASARSCPGTRRCVLVG